MANEQEVRESLIDFIRRNTSGGLAMCKVVSVNEGEATCDVSPIDNEGLTWYDVRLRVLPESGPLLIPKTGSYVIVGILGQSQGFCVVQFSGIDKAYLSAENGIAFNGGTLGGLVKAQTLAAELNKNNQLLSAILAVINGSPVPEAGNGAASALQVALKAAVVGKPLGDFSALENNDIKQ